MIVAMMVSASYLIAAQVLDSVDESRATEKPKMYWLFNIWCLLATSMPAVANALFLWFAFWDANRRIYLMRLLSSALEIDFHTKNKTSIRMPSLNFMDTKSLLTWLEARKLVLETGNRFQIRIQYHVSYFLLVVSAQLALIFAVLGTFIPSDILTMEQWISFTITAAFLFIFAMMILLPTSYLNTEVRWQMKRLTRIREVY